MLSLKIWKHEKNVPSVLTVQGFISVYTFLSFQMNFKYFFVFFIVSFFFFSIEMPFWK